ncbi:MAG: hypothetical protein MUF06_24535, partial [Pirellulaceae bacterium]|nr:hypothetical protein [Pirellulaceae bacterium]
MKINLRCSRGVLLALGALVLVPVATLVSGQARAQPPRTVVELAEPPAAQPANTDPASVEPGPLAEQPTPAQPIGSEPAPVQAQVSDDGAAPIDAGAIPEQLPAPDDEAVASPLDAAPIEIVKERYENGVVRIEREVTQDAAGNYIPHGLWRQYDPTGRLIAEGRYVESRKEGIWRRLYRGDDAALFATQPYRTFTPPFVSQATFKSGRLHGKWIITDAKERKVHELSFQEGQRNGPSIWYYPSGQVLQTGEYVGGRAHGDFVQYGESGDSVSRESYQEGRKLAPRIDYYDGAQLVKKTEAMILHAPLVRDAGGVREPRPGRKTRWLHGVAQNRPDRPPGRIPLRPAGRQVPLLVCQRPKAARRRLCRRPAARRLDLVARERPQVDQRLVREW